MGQASYYQDSAFSLTPSPRAMPYVPFVCCATGTAHSLQVKTGGTNIVNASDLGHPVQSWDSLPMCHRWTDPRILKP